MAYSEEELNNFKETIINGLINGRSLLSMEKAGETPCRATIFNWLNAEHVSFDNTFLNNYTRAREESGEYYAEFVIDIANKVESGELEPDQARVILDAYKWTAGVRKPKKFGKIIDVTSGGDKIQSAPTAINIGIVKPLED